jgi:hypothetical protein
MHRRSWLLTALALALPGAAYADEWAIDASASARLRNTDNLDLNAGDAKIRADVVSLSPDMRFSSRTEVRDVSGSIGIGANQVSNHSERNTLDYHASALANWQGERASWSMMGSLLRDSTLQTELRQTGIVQAHLQRTNLVVQPSTSFQITETTALQASLNGSAVRYETNNSGLIDYDDRSATLGLTSALGERTTIGVQVNEEIFQTTPATTKSRVASASATLRWQYSERLRLGLDAGSQRTVTDRQVTEYTCAQSFFGLFCLRWIPVTRTLHTQDTTPNLNATANYAMERGDATLQISRRLTPNGSGSLISTNRVSLDGRYGWSERLSQSFSASSISSHYPEQTTADVRYTAFGTTLSWQYDRQITVDAGVSRSEQRTVGGTAVARANEVFVALAYRWDPLTMSR